MRQTATNHIHSENNPIHSQRTKDERAQESYYILMLQMGHYRCPRLLQMGHY